MRLPECRAVLTGASGGIGLALAEKLCAGGAQLIAVTRQEGALSELLQLYPKQVRVVAADLGSASGRQAVVDAARALGGVNLLINAAGVNRFALLEQLDDQAVAELLGINLVATIQLTRAMLPLLRQHLPGAEHFADAPLHPEEVLIWRVGQALRSYHAACGLGST